MQKSSLLPQLLKPTVYETFVRSWSASTSSSAASSTGASSASNTTSSTPTTTSRSLSNPSPATRATPRTWTSVPTQQTRKFGSFTRPVATRTHNGLSSGIVNNSNSSRTIRRMASNQPLTPSTLPTAEELKLETSPSTLRTAPGVSLTDKQALLTASVLDLFAGQPSLRKLTLWADTATFQDPLTVAEGRAQFAAQWYGLRAAFSRIERLSYQVTGAGNPITMDLSTKYKVVGVGTEKVIDSVIEIYVDEATGKIGKVLDKWDGELGGGAVKHAFRKLNAVSVPLMVGVPKSIEEEEKSGK